MQAAVRRLCAEIVGATVRWVRSVTDEAGSCIGFDTRIAEHSFYSVGHVVHFDERIARKAVFLHFLVERLS